MSARVSQTLHGSQAARVEVENGRFVLGVADTGTNDLHEVKRNTLPAPVLGPILNVDFVSHINSFRGHFAPATIAEAGGVASLSGGRDKPSYTLRGRFASRCIFMVPEDLTLRDEPTPMPQLPRWYSIAAFLIMSSATIFAMCAIGRPGA